MMSKVQECRAALIEALAEERKKIEAEIRALGGAPREVALKITTSTSNDRTAQQSTAYMPSALGLLAFVKDHPGCSGTEINKALGINAAQAMRLRAALGRKLKMTGKKRGARYSIRGGA
jgi:hypothetical protein